MREMMKIIIEKEDCVMSSSYALFVCLYPLNMNSYQFFRGHILSIYLYESRMTRSNNYIDVRPYLTSLRHDYSYRSYNDIIRYSAYEKIVDIDNFRLDNSNITDSMVDCLVKESQSHDVDDVSKNTSSVDSFDFQWSLILASYAFESYNNIASSEFYLNDHHTVKKTSHTKDDIKITHFSIPNHLPAPQIYQGMLTITLDKGSIIYDQTLSMESIFTGTKPDPYVVIRSYSTVLEASSPSPSSKTLKVIKHRHIDSSPSIHDIDSIRSSAVSNNKLPEWQEHYQLWTHSPDTTTIEFSVYDKQLWGNDIFIGNAIIPLRDITDSLPSSPSDTQSSSSLSSYGEILLPIPIYADNSVVDGNSWFSLLSNRNMVKRMKTIRMGTLLVQLGYQALKRSVEADDDSHQDDEDDDVDGHQYNDGREDDVVVMNLPRGASPGVVDWSHLLRKILPRDSRIPHRYLNTADSSPCVNNDADTIDDADDDDDDDKEEEEKKNGADMKVSKLQVSISTGNMKPISFIDSIETDTQLMIWADTRRNSRQIIIAFRGTETTRAKDVLTDINLLQVPFFEMTNEHHLHGVTVHQGFLNAYKSIQLVLLKQLWNLFQLDSNNNNNDFTSSNTTCSSSSPSFNATIFSTSSSAAASPWDVYITGHSLGGALAVLSSFDLARIKEGWVYEEVDNFTVDGRITPSTPDSPASSSSSLLPSSSSSSSSNNIGLSFYENDLFMKVLNASSFYTYTYGTPRVGNSDFVRAFNTMVSHCFCVVNQQDIIARLPRSFNGTFVDYSHVGRTVIIGQKGDDSSSNNNNDDVNVDEIGGDNYEWIDDDGFNKATDRIWIEGESTSPNPIEDISIMNNIPSTSILSIEPSSTSFTKLSDSIIDYSNKMVSSLLDNVDLSITKAMSDAASGYDIRAALTTHGLSIDKLPIEKWIVLPKEFNAAFVERELELLNTLLNKTAVMHHLEPSYFEAYCNAMRGRKS